MIEPLVLERPGWYVTPFEARDEMKAWAKKRHAGTGILTTFLVDRIEKRGGGPGPAGCGFQRGHGSIVAVASAKAVAHEVAHNLGAVDLTGDKNCGPRRKCNVMTYCRDSWSWSCDGPRWTRTQLALMRLPR